MNIKKITPFIMAFVLTRSVGYSQTIDFTLANPQPNLINVYGGSFASGDIDGDGDKDLLIAGLDPGRRTALYFNDGKGDFTKATNVPFPDASSGTTIFKDLDGDGDLDLFFSGRGFNIDVFTHIYLNDGTGAFTQLLNPALPNIDGSGAAIEDVDNDGDADIVISELNASGTIVTGVYLNNGSAIFSAMGSTAFSAVKNGVVTFIDAEGDGDNDVIISGTDASNNASVKLYLNNGNGVYTVSSNVFESIAADDIDVADTDNDGDLDILISGTKTSSTPTTALYTNDGNGVFTATATNFQQTFFGANAIADFDNDGDLDVLICGSQKGGIPNIFNIVYQNVGNNIFNAVDTLGGEYIASCVIEDFNGDNKKDILIQGFVESTTLYWNNTILLSSVDEKLKTGLVNIYPNPSNGKLFIDPIDEREYSIEIYNMHGELMHGHNVLQGPISLHLGLANGIYLTLIKSEHTVTTKRLIIHTD